jgi:hypothetical protein
MKEANGSFALDENDKPAHCSTPKKLPENAAADDNLKFIEAYAQVDNYVQFGDTIEVNVTVDAENAIQEEPKDKRGPNK